MRFGKIDEVAGDAALSQTVIAWCGVQRGIWRECFETSLRATTKGHVFLGDAFEARKIQRRAPKRRADGGTRGGC